MRTENSKKTKNEVLKIKKPRSAVFKHRGGCSWKGVAPTIYKKAADPFKGKPARAKKGLDLVKGDLDPGWTSVTRHLLVAGERGEKTRFHLRYFEVSPGGYTSLETHRHEHVVVVIKGRGKVRLGRRLHELDYLDTIYISPGDPHRLLNPYEEPFGFFCIVDARRDKPVPLSSPPLPFSKGRGRQKARGKG